MKKSTLFLILIFCCAPVATGFAQGVDVSDPWSDERAGMIAGIEKDVRDTAELINRGSFDRRVMEAMATVPRHEFVPAAMEKSAYDDHPLPIGEGQTISQPYIVALMTDLIGVKPDMRILEVGTGSGYQAAVLAELVQRVYSIEILPEGRSIDDEKDLIDSEGDRGFKAQGI